MNSIDVIEAKDVETKEFGEDIVADPRICHGKLTIRGTRLLVSVILEMVGEGIDWDTIVAQWHGRFPRKAISEAVLLARDALLISYLLSCAWWAGWNGGVRFVKLMVPWNERRWWS